MSQVSGTILNVWNILSHNIPLLYMRGMVWRDAPYQGHTAGEKRARTWTQAEQFQCPLVKAGYLTAMVAALSELQTRLSKQARHQGMEEPLLQKDKHENKSSR